MKIVGVHSLVEENSGGSAARVVAYTYPGKLTVAFITCLLQYDVDWSWVNESMNARAHTHEPVDEPIARKKERP